MRYDNGELVTKDRIEDEDWYATHYQPFLEILMGYLYNAKEPNVDDLFQEAKKDLVLTGDTMTPELEARILRWSVLHIERESHNLART